MQGRETGRVEGGGGLAGDASSRRVVLVRGEGEGAGEGEVRRGEGRRGKARQGVCVMQVCIRLYAEPRCSDRNGWMWMWMWMGWDGLLCWLLACLLGCWPAGLLASRRRRMWAREAVWFAKRRKAPVDSAVAGLWAGFTGLGGWGG
jgi:hypothetical protein